MSSFSVFSAAVRERFASLSQGKLFVVDSDRDEIWSKYLEGFPADLNPFFRKRTEHDCSCCRHFVRAIGNVVEIQNGQLKTVWDLELKSPYQVVADNMAAYVRSKPVRDLYLTKFAKAGQEYSIELTPEGQTIRWDHFSADIPKRFLSATPGERQGEARAAHQVFRRGVMELNPEMLQVVLDLIEQNAIYRGAEFQGQLKAFQQLQNAFRSSQNELLLWELLDSPASRLRNSAIGTLLQDLSDGVEVERAVKAFESKVAPANYKRPTALITPRMVEDAMKTITELDLEPALARRHAKLSDVSVGSVLWVDNTVRGQLKGGLAGKLLEEVKPAAFDPQKARKISLQDFLAMRHPGGIKLYLDNTLLPNFMSLTAPVDPNVRSIFRWNNNFAWSYEGNVADSIKDKVKRAGGQVEGVALRTSLAWFNYDDLDLHCHCPYGHVYFRDKMNILDVDMNAGRGHSREPVENMRWRAPRDGVYSFSVNNFCRREPVDVGFVVEMESDLGLHTFRYPKSVANATTVEVCSATVKNGRVTSVTPAAGIECGQASQTYWGLKTLDLVKLQAIILSPNYWDDNAVGNKHWFFILEGCRNPEPCRGIYNEFLHPRLEQHRKVFEILGAKTKCPVVDEQMSGVGFSSTRNDQVVVVSNGVPYAIQFGS